MRIWITADPVGELSAEEEQAAADAGAGIIYHGVPPRLADLVADPTLAAALDGGQYATIYLSPRDYHRVHAPVAGPKKSPANAMTRP